MWNNLHDDNYQQTPRCHQVLELDRCCMCIQIPVGVKILAVIDLVVFTYLSYVLTTAPDQPVEFYLLYCLATLLPACAGFSLLLITGQTNTARNLYFIAWVVRYSSVLLLGVYGLMQSSHAMTKEICAKALGVPIDDVMDYSTANQYAWENCRQIEKLLAGCWVVYLCLGLHVLLVLRQYVHEGGPNEIELISPTKFDRK